MVLLPSAAGGQKNLYDVIYDYSFKNSYWLIILIVCLCCYNPTRFVTPFQDGAMKDVITVQIGNLSIEVVNSGTVAEWVRVDHRRWLKRCLLIRGDHI